MNTEKYTAAMYAKGMADAADLQKRSASMDGTALYDEQEKIPDFQAARQVMSMADRLAGFICRSTAGRIFKLITPYDSQVAHTEEPEAYPSLWAPYWSKDPKHAVDFMAVSTAPWMIGDCCKWEDGHVYRSKEDNNVWSPGDQPQRWEDLGTIEEVMGV